MAELALSCRQARAESREGFTPPILDAGFVELEWGEVPEIKADNIAESGDGDDQRKEEI